MDLTNVSDVNQLNELYVQCNEALLGAQAEVQTQAQNMQIIRARILELRSAAKNSKGKTTSK